MDSETRKIQLVASDDEEPRVKLVAGKRFEVVATTVVDQDMRAVTDQEQQVRPARLCGSRSTCLAVVELE